MYSLRFMLGIMILFGISLRETYAFTLSSKHTKLSHIPTFSAIHLHNHHPRPSSSSSSSVVRWNLSEKVAMDTTQQQQQPAWNHRLQMIMSQMKRKMKHTLMIPKKKRCRIHKKVSTALAILTLCFSTMFSMPHTALASSGGRMGGSFKSSPSRSYSSSPSRSSSSSRTSYYGSSTRLYAKTRTAMFLHLP